MSGMGTSPPWPSANDSSSSGGGSAPAPPDASISSADALDYWTSVPATVDGMLGGFPQITRVDLQGSANFLAKLRRASGGSSSNATAPLGRAADCGAGIGRITLGFLSRVAGVVDIVEPVGKFTDEVRSGAAFAELRAQGRVGEIVNVGLEDWVPEAGRYDLVWNQWCLGQLKDRALEAYLRRCGRALKEGGWVVVKENLSTEDGGRDVFDEVDSSVTRSEASWLRIFEHAGMVVVRSELQRGFPSSLFPVKTFALRPREP